MGWWIEWIMGGMLEQSIRGKGIIESTIFNRVLGGMPISI